MDPGLEDESVLMLAGDQNTLPVTADKDFGELVFRLDLSYTEMGLVNRCHIPELPL